MTVLFVVALAVLLLPWTVYPAALWLAARWRPRPSFGAALGEPPGVSVVIAARDEVAHLEAKLDSLAQGGIPADRLEVIVVDDASDDDTAWLAATRSVRVISFGEPRGKAAALNAGVAAASNELVVLTDARQPISPGALRELVQRFGDPSVGAVSGELEGGAVGAGAAYRRFDDAIRRAESAIGSTIGVTGALWACRRALWPTLPDGLILDDVYAPMSIARAGHRVVVEPRARAVELPSHTGPLAERRRRVRTLAGNLELVARAPWLLLPVANPLWGRFVQHKLLRLAGPFALAGTILALAARATSSATWAALAIGAALGLGVAALGPRAGRIGLLARGFLAAQLLCAIAWREALLGRIATLWRPAPSPPRPAEVVVPASRSSGPPRSEP
jgi:hypothetical protein